MILYVQINSLTIYNRVLIVSQRLGLTLRTICERSPGMFLPNETK